MKLRLQNDRSDTRRALKLRESSIVMQPDSSERGANAGNGLSLTLQPELLTRTPAPGAAAATNPENIEVRVPMTSGPGESGGGASSRRCRINSHGHSHSQSHGHHRVQHHPNSEPELDSPDSDTDSGEPSTSMSELRCLFRWIQKSLPFLVLLCAKLVIQHALGLAVGVGLFITFLYVNKNIQTQVFLQERQSKLQSGWLLLFLISSTLLLYYTFLTETLYYWRTANDILLTSLFTYAPHSGRVGRLSLSDGGLLSLIFLSPAIEPLGFWEVLWAVGVTNFVIKFLCMGIKCLILLLPSSLVTYRAQGRWMMLAEEMGQIHQAVAPVPLWFRYLVIYQEADGTPGLTLGVLLALLYLILKLLGLYAQWTSFLKTVRIFLKGEHTGSAATRSQCSEAGDVCPICQGEYREPRALLCQHIFCDECIALWFNREKSCPLCRTVITEKVYKWRDGATSPHLQIY